MFRQTSSSSSSSLSSSLLFLTAVCLHLSLLVRHVDCQMDRQNDKHSVARLMKLDAKFNKMKFNNQGNNRSSSSPSNISFPLLASNFTEETSILSIKIGNKAKNQKSKIEPVHKETKGSTFNHLSKDEDDFHTIVIKETIYALKFSNSPYARFFRRKYVISYEIGHGGYGIVYKAVEIATFRFVCITLIFSFIHSFIYSFIHSFIHYYSY